MHDRAPMGSSGPGPFRLIEAAAYVGQPRWKPIQGEKHQQIGAFLSTGGTASAGAGALESLG